MKKQLLIILAVVFVAAAIISVFLIVQKNKKIAGATTATNPGPQYPKIEKYEVPILMYHYIRVASANDDLGQKLSVTPTNFNEQMKYLKDNGYVTIKLSDVADPEKKELSRIYFEKKKPIVLTFDDGYQDAYTQAFSILKKNDFKGVFFIIRDYADKVGYLSQTQIDEMRNASMEIGSHTLSHPDLSKLNTAEQHKQIFDSKEDANTFCYPSGKYNNETINLVKEAGYAAAVTTKIGVARETSDLYTLPRVRVENVSPQALMDKIEYALEHS